MAGKRLKGSDMTIRRTPPASSGGGGSVATDTIFDAKGDLPVGTGVDTASKLTVGANGYLLTPNSDAASGLEWADNLLAIPGISGQYYTASVQNVGVVTVTLTQNLLWYHPIFLRKGTLDRIGIRVAATSASHTCRVGIYQNAAGRVPGSLLLDAGSLSMSAATGLVTATISQAVETGIYWLAAVMQGGAVATMAGTTTGASAAAGGFTPFPIKGPDFTSTSVGPYAFSEAGVTGSLPATPTALPVNSGGTSSPVIGIRYA